MPKIPVYTADVPLNPGSAPSIQVDASNFTAQAAEGAAISGLGNEVNLIGRQFQKRDEEKSNFNAGVSNDTLLRKQTTAVDEAAQKMPADGSGFHDTTLVKLDQMAEETFAGMPKEQGEKYRAKYQAQREGWSLQLAQMERKQGSEYAGRQIDDAVSLGVSQINANPDPRVTDQVHERVADQIRNATYWSEAEKAKKLEDWDQAAKSTEAMQRFRANPIAASKELGIPLQGVRGFEAALVNRESGGKPDTVNKFGYAGAYQFGAPLLQTLGMYTPGKNEDMDNWSSSRKDSAGKWSGEFNVPGFPQVKTLQDFLNTPGAQKAAFDNSTAYYDKEISDRGLDRYIGQTVGGTQISREGLYGMMHLGGVAGAEATLKSDGKTNARDANGTDVLSYARLAQGGGEPSARYADLPFTARQKIVFNSEKQATEQQAAVQQQAKVDAFAVGRLVTDDLASLKATGRGVDTLTPERISATLGPAAAVKWQEDRTHAMNVFTATNGFDRISNEEIQAREDRVRPGASGGVGYDQQVKLYQEVHEKAQDIIQKRAADPAEAVDQSAPVRTARERMVTDHSVQAREALVEARIAAQASLGIPQYNRSPITVDEAKQYASKMRPLARGQADVADQDKVISGVVQEINDKYGRYGKDVLQRVLYQVTLKKDASEVLASAMQRMQTADSGPLVKTEEGRKVETEDTADKIVRYTEGGAVEPTNRKPFDNAVSELRKDPDKLLPMFIQRFGVGRVPADLRPKPKQDGRTTVDATGEAWSPN